MQQVSPSQVNIRSASQKYFSVLGTNCSQKDTFFIPPMNRRDYTSKRRYLASSSVTTQDFFTGLKRLGAETSPICCSRSFLI